MPKPKKADKFAPSEGLVSIGQNVFAKVDGGKLIIECDMGANLGASATGKSLKIASTGGNVSIGQGLKLGFNLYEPISKA